MTTPEGKVQSYGAQQFKKHGCLVRKIGYEGRRGCPDQLVGVPRYVSKIATSFGYSRNVVLAARTLFIEYKAAEDIEPEAHQVREHERMRAVGMDVRVIGSKRQVDELIKELFPCG